ncbi:MAG: hypothetical protein JW749_09245 [Sedimentisphaerales bacterium]|nr:hypothetical protein [Sedimentisphaerales bacterium]
MEPSEQQSPDCYSYGAEIEDRRGQGRRKTEDGGQKTENRIENAEYRMQNAEKIEDTTGQAD